MAETCCHEIICRIESDINKVVLTFRRTSYQQTNVITGVILV